MRNELKEAFREAVREYRAGKRKAQVGRCYECRLWEMIEPSMGDDGRPIIEGECRWFPPATGCLPVPAGEQRLVRVGEEPALAMDLLFRSAPTVVPAGYGCAQHRPRGGNGVTLEAL